MFRYCTGKGNSGHLDIAQVNLQPSGTSHCANVPESLSAMSHSGELGLGRREVLDRGNQEIFYLFVGREQWGALLVLGSYEIPNLMTSASYL